MLENEAPYDRTQRLAADPAHSVWLAAHAGTGKTKVLVDRMLRLLLSGVAPSDILAITFTKAAAAEMQGRLRRQLADWAAADEAARREKLEKLLRRVAQPEEEARAAVLLRQVTEDRYGLQIETIHGFCQSLLSRFPLEAGLNPDFTVLDDVADSRLLFLASQEMLNAAQADAELKDALTGMARAAGDGTIAKLMQAIIGDAEHFSSWLLNPGAEKQWREALYRGLDLEPDTTQESVVASAIGKVPADAACGLIVTLLEDAGGVKNLQTAQALRDWLASPKAEPDLQALLDHFLTAKGEPKADSSLMSKKVAEHNPASWEDVQRLRELAVDAGEAFAALRDVEFSQKVTTIALRLLSLYEQMKQERAALNYQDLILYTLRLLQKPDFCGWVFSQLDRRIQHILLDEAQDTSPQQWHLTHLLVKELFQPDLAAQSGRTLFVVGDYKQSIYRFQGADPAQFADTRRHMSSYFAEGGMPFMEYTLDTSFRSAAAVLKLVDAVCIHPACSGVADEEVLVAHQVFHAQRAGRAELWPLIEKQEAEIPAAWDVDRPLYEQENAAALLAAKISGEIKQWLDEKRVLAGRGRAVRADDILILVRQRGPFFRMLMRQLQRDGVPVAGADRLRLSESQMAEDVLNLAEFCLLPEDDYALAVVLKGPYFAFSEEALFALAYGRAEATLWQRLQEAHPDVAAKLAALRDLHLPVYEWLQAVFRRMGDALAACHGAEGEDVRRELLAQALQCEQQRGPGLQLWVDWVRGLTRDIKREQGSGGVRMMTVHGAKGLEAPVVILPDTTSLPQSREVLWWMRAGDQAVAYAVPSSDGASATLKRLKEAHQAEDRAEYMRLLYVALTRAEDELIVCGYSNRNLPENSWYQLVADSMHTLEAEETEDGRLILRDDLPPAEAQAEAEEEAATPPLPAWWRSAPPEEQVRTVRTASQRESEQDYGPGSGEGAERAARRGDAIHLLLELQLQDAPQARALLEQAMPALASEVVEEVIAEAQMLLNKPELRWVFSGETVAELPLQSSDTSGVLRGYIDRVTLTDEAVHIIDYKSNAKIPDAAPEHYAAQLLTYKQMLSPFYPERDIRCWLLWTRDGSMLEVRG
jgi:ATP-dependent helicase/nuclease subunit A